MWKAYKLYKYIFLNQYHHPFKIPKACQLITVVVVDDDRTPFLSWLHSVSYFLFKTLVIRKNKSANGPLSLECPIPAR